MLSARAAIAFVFVLGACAGEEPAPSVASGPIDPPKPGSYVYDWSGRALDPDDQSKVLNEVKGLSQTQKVSRDGKDYTTEVTTERVEGVTRIRTRWEDDRVQLISSEPSGGVGCTFEPPVELFRIPLRHGSIPKQSWESENCSGSIEVEVIGRSRAPDVAGRNWETWKLEVRIETTTAGGTLFENETRWLSPELGMDIRTERVAEGTSDGRRFLRETSTALRDRP